MEFDIEKYKDEKNKLIFKGFDEGKIFIFPKTIFNRLRPYSQGGVPLSLMLFIPDFCQGFCYDRALMMSMAFKDSKYVCAEIDDLRVQYGEGKDAEHAYIETSDLDDGKTYIVDTSVGLVYEKEYFEMLENPKVKYMLSKEQCMKSRGVLEMLASDFETEMDSLLLVLPLIENYISSLEHDNLDSGNEYTTYLRKTFLLNEIEKLKTAINFDGMLKEMNDDLELIRQDPIGSEKILDEKYKIVRDKYGRIVSRSGVEDEFYIPANEDFDKICENLSEEEIVKLLNDDFKKIHEKHNNHDKRIYELAQKRLKEIEKDPYKNVYEFWLEDREKRYGSQSKRGGSSFNRGGTQGGSNLNGDESQSGSQPKQE